MTPDQIKTIRTSMNLTQKQFAALLGLSPRTIEGWEAGYGHPNAQNATLMNTLTNNHSDTYTEMLRHIHEAQQLAQALTTLMPTNTTLPTILHHLSAATDTAG